LPFRSGLGGALGDGQQWMSWIHINDIVGLFVHALENPSMEGPVNGSAPYPVTNRDFSKSLASALGKSLGPSVPTFALKTLFGEMSSFILASLRASADRAQSLGYKFQFEDIDDALTALCAPFKNGEEIFYAEQFIPLPPEKVFPFFQNAHNLEKITPPTLNFTIRGISTDSIQQGTLIDYDLKIHGVPAKWKTEIDEWQPPHKFVDHQLKGPYQLWHHTHEFRPFCGGTLMIDKVRYKLPLGMLGKLVGGSFVKKDVTNIFNFRRKFVAAHNWAAHI
jgi:ligand-binding SRPBCC domain-containing protein